MLVTGSANTRYWHSGKLILMVQYWPMMCDDSCQSGPLMPSLHAKWSKMSIKKQVAQLSQRDRTTLCVEYFAKSLEVIQNDAVEWSMCKSLLAGWPLVWKTSKCWGIWQLSGKCPAKHLVTEKLPKTVYCKLYICVHYSTYDSLDDSVLCKFE